MGQNSSKSLVSVIVPVFNGVDHISEALDSVFDQTFQRFEVIVVDDGSTDGTREIVENYGAKIRYFYQENSGAGSARNNGFDLSRGEFIAFLDADDSWPTTKLEKQVSALESDSGLDAVTGYFKNVPQSKWASRNAGAADGPGDLLAGYSPSVFLIRREAFLKVGMFETESKVGEVVDWFVRAREQGLNIKVLPELFLWRRIHGRNNGIRNKGFSKDYVKALKRSIDRRRALGSGSRI